MKGRFTIQDALAIKRPQGCALETRPCAVFGGRLRIIAARTDPASISDAT